MLSSLPSSVSDCNQAGLSDDQAGLPWIAKPEFPSDACVGILVKVANGSESSDPLLSALSAIASQYVCPITHEFPKDPVVIKDHPTADTFERAALISHFENRRERELPLTHPMTNEVLSFQPYRVMLSEDVRCLSTLESLYEARSHFTGELVSKLEDWHVRRLKQKACDSCSSRLCLECLNFPGLTASDKFELYIAGTLDSEESRSESRGICFFYAGLYILEKRCERAHYHARSAGMYNMKQSAGLGNEHAMKYLAWYHFAESHKWYTRSLQPKRKWEETLGDVSV